MKKIFFYIILFCLLTACNSIQKKHAASDGHFEKIEWSKRFGLYNNSEGTRLFHLNGRDTFWAPFNADKKPKRIAVLSTVFAGFLELLNAHDCIVAVEKAEYYSDPVIRRRILNDSIIVCGEEGQIQLEKLLSVKPDIVVAGSAEFLSGAVGIKLKTAGITVLYCDNFLEQHPLARAEWIRYFGVLAGKQQKADSLFESVKNNYLSIASQNDSTPYKPLVMTDALFGDSWFVPGGETYTSQLIADAGGRYVFSDKKPLHTYPLSLEEVLTRAGKADVWIHTNQYVSLKNMETADRRYKLFKPFTTGNVFNYNKRENPEGGNDFWETGVGRPDMILSDLHIIFSADTSRYRSMHYYRQLR